MRLFSILTIIALALQINFAKAGEPDASIQAVIADQISAFQKNDLDRAFSHASPGIQRIFQTPRRFGEMVESGYPMVWRPARYEWLKIVNTDSGPVQVVLFEDSRGRLHEAGYLMELIDGVWRISGVKLRQSEGYGA
ncbi:MAG: DUF4864 domain-containing protein [Pseudomonadota bacterium]